MSEMLRIYILGCLIAFGYSIYSVKDDNRVDIIGMLFSLFIGLFSWIGVLALLLGRSARK
jgi:hypothetical protein